MISGACDQSRVHQSYSRNYQLPNTTAHNETCAAIGNVLWNWRIFLASGDSRFIDVLELSLYNSVLSGISLTGTDYLIYRPEGDWLSALYRPLKHREDKTITARFVPYFAWANRGEAEMSVWFPLAE